MKKPQLQKKNIVIILLGLILLAGVFLLSTSIEKAKASQSVTISDLPGIADVSMYSKLIISEVVSNNGGVYVNEHNQCCDYVELYNGGESEIDLTGFGLSDRDDSVKWAFTGGTISPGEYLVIGLSGTKASGLNANFKLSSKGGERLILTNKSGHIIDGVDMVALGKNQCLVRDGASWIASNLPTPGFENSKSGYEEYINSLMSSDEDALVINEFLCKNDGNFLSESKRFDGYIEIKNVSDKTVLLSDYYLSNDKAVPFKFNLPDIHLYSGQIFSIYTGDASAIDENYTGFSLDNKQGSIILSSKGKITSLLEYSNVPNGCCYVRGDNKEYYVSADLSMGYENNAEGIKKFQQQFLKKNDGLIINEIMSSNSKYLPQNGYSFYDWIELYNNSGKAVNLAEYSLSNSSANPSLQSLPDYILKPGEYYIVMCSGDNNLSNDAYFHANFKIGETESIYLFRGNEIIDSVFVYGIPTDYSYGRGADYGFTYTNEATPGAENKAGYISKSPAPSFDISAGIYNDISSLTISLLGQGDIYYTLDGSYPTEKSEKYSVPIELSKPCVVKAASFVDGGLISDCICSSYIINDPHDVPVVSLSLDPDKFETFYSNPFGENQEYQAYFEIFEDGDYEICPCGISLMGNTGRRYAKKNFALRFEGEWGASDLNYRLFDEVDNSRFDSISIRGGSNAEESLPWKDEFATELAKDYLEVRNYKQCIVYINGEYRGYYNIREKINAEMIADHYNIDKTFLNMQRIDGEVEYGNPVWTDIVDWAENHDLSIEENYKYIEDRVDLTQLCDLWIYQAFFDNSDIYNIRIFQHPDIDGGKCKFIFFDLDYAFYGYVENFFKDIVFNETGYAPNQNGVRYDVRINVALMKNEKFKKLFRERLEYHVNNNLKAENCIALYDSFVASYEKEITRTMNANGYTTDWYNKCVSYFRRVMTSRADNLLKQLKQLGF